MRFSQSVAGGEIAEAALRRLTALRRRPLIPSLAGGDSAGVFESVAV
jgi:hypothetical protein